VHGLHAATSSRCYCHGSPVTPTYSAFVWVRTKHVSVDTIIVHSLDAAFWCRVGSRSRYSHGRGVASPARSTFLIRKHVSMDTSTSAWYMGSRGARGGRCCGSTATLTTFRHHLHTFLFLVAVFDQFFSPSSPFFASSLNYSHLSYVPPSDRYRTVLKQIYFL